MDTTEMLQDVLEYVDEHITDNLSANLLAAHVGFSTWHFCRLFQWGVGYSVMGYVRSRRLAFAACELNSDQRILDIALKYGFETHSGFSKAFRRYFGYSPIGPFFDLLLGQAFMRPRANLARGTSLLPFPAALRFDYLFLKKSKRRNYIWQRSIYGIFTRGAKKIHSWKSRMKCWKP